MDEKQVLLVTPQEAREISAVRRRKYVGGGGIDVQTSPDGLTVTIILRRLSHATASPQAESVGLHQGDIRQMMTDEEAGWGPAQFGP